MQIFSTCQKWIEYLLRDTSRIRRLKVKQNIVLAVKVFNLLKIIYLNQIIVEIAWDWFWKEFK